MIYCFFSNTYLCSAHTVIIQEIYYMWFKLRLKIKKTGNFKNSKKYLKMIEEASVYDVSILACKKDDKQSKKSSSVKPKE